MFSASNTKLTDTLPQEINDFIVKSGIKVINNAGYFGGGVDYVFSFLFKGATKDIFECALDNMHYDTRFNREERIELTSIVMKLANNGVYHRNQPKTEVEASHPAKPRF